MNVCNLFSTQERLKILNSIIYKTEPFTVSKVAYELKLSKGLVSKYFRILLKENVISISREKFRVKNSLPTKSLRLLLNLSISSLGNIFGKHKFVRGAGFYGSFAKGTNTEESDIDLWLLVERTEEKNIARLTNELKKRSEKIKPLYLTEEKINALKRKDTVFYHSLVFGSINIYGEGIEEV